MSYQVPIEWDEVDVTPVKGRDGTMQIPPRCIELMQQNKVGLKGPLATPVGKGHRSLNLAVRKSLLLCTVLCLSFCVRTFF